MSNEYRMSQTRLDELQDELNYLKTTRSDEVAEQIKIARGFGDLSENSEYDEAKNEQGKLYSRIAELEEVLQHAVVVDESAADNDTVTIGCKVTVADAQGNVLPKAYKIVGSQESDPMNGIISEESPFGKALMGAKEGQTVTVEVCRGGRQITLPGLAIPAAAADADAWPGELVGICGSINAERVVAGSPAWKAGMRDGDRILTIAYDGEPRRNIGDTRDFIEAISGGNGRPVTITGLRGKTPFSVTVQPERSRELDPPRYAIGVILGSGPGRILMHVDPWTQFTEVVGQTTRTLGLLFKPITARVHGAVTGKQVEAPRNQVGLKHMSGPGGILMMLWFRLQSEGYRGGFAFIILITFSLAFMNLLPLPVLDGGHIVFAGIEALIHRRLPARAFTWLYNTFAILLIALMVYITFYDGKRFIKYNSRHDTPVKPAAPASTQPDSPQPAGEGAASK